MKKILLSAIALFIGINFASAQTTVFSDNFESYTNSQSLISAELYQSWEALYAACLDGIGANNSTKYASLTSGNANKTQYFRKTLSVTEGHSYTYKVYTKSKIDKQHKIGYKLGTASGVLYPATTVLSHTIWTESQMLFTVPAGTTTVDIWVQYYGGASNGNGVDVDEMVLIDNTITTSIDQSKSAAKAYAVGHNVFVEGGQMIEVYNLAGNLVKREQLTNNSFEIEQKGAYLLRIQSANGVSNHKIVIQ